MNRPSAHPYSGTNFDRIVSVAAGGLIVLLAIFLLIRNQPIASPELFFSLRFVLSFAVATLGATVPGFMNIKWEGKGLLIRAGGALALFFITLFYTPTVIFEKTSPKNSVNGSGIIIGRDNNNSPINQNAR